MIKPNWTIVPDKYGTFRIEIPTSLQNYEISVSTPLDRTDTKYQINVSGGTMTIEQAEKLVSALQFAIAMVKE